MQGKSAAETVRQFAYGFERGGPFAMRARLLAPVWAGLILWLGFFSYLRRSVSLRIWIVAIVVATLFPLTYETLNPERYWTLALLWSLLGTQAIARWRQQILEFAGGRASSRATRIK